MCNLLQSVLTSSLDSSSEDVKAVASQALGGVAIGNLSTYLPFILKQIQGQVPHNCCAYGVPLHLQCLHCAIHVVFCMCVTTAAGFAALDCGFASAPPLQLVLLHVVVVLRVHHHCSWFCSTRLCLWTMRQTRQPECSHAWTKQSMSTMIIPC